MTWQGIAAGLTVMIGLVMVGIVLLGIHTIPLRKTPRYGTDSRQQARLREAGKTNRPKLPR
ncbi:hypothetical protein KC722_00350 [Candidatus Kaiserbacteria bacterium]|nr:hypothetical protein [Candidatus Kaiserbacteria bacterium]MCB9811954.1 hypothetical protein [Candidatus Nomurabacteria bacterium]